MFDRTSELKPTIEICTICGEKFTRTTPRCCTDIENSDPVCGKCKAKHKLKSGFDILDFLQNKKD